MFYVASESGSGVAVQSPITGKITNKGRKLRDPDPAGAAPAGAGVDASLTGARRRRSRAKRGKNYLVSSIGCKNAQAQVHRQADVHRRAPTAPPVPAPVDATRRTPSARSSALSQHARRSIDGPATAGPSSFLDSCAVLVFAHGIVGRADLPIPEALFGAAAAAVLVISFVALAPLWSQPRLQRRRERRLFRLPARRRRRARRARRRSCSRVTAYAGLRRHRGRARQPRADDGLRRVLGRRPVRVAAARRRLAAAQPVARDRPRRPGWLAARLGGDELPEPLAYPERLGRWPAAAGVLAFGICELCWATAREPAPLAVLMLVYVVVMLVGMSLYGVEAWTRNADAFGVYFGLFAALAPSRGATACSYARPPVVGATGLDAASPAPPRCCSRGSA